MWLMGGLTTSTCSLPSYSTIATARRPNRSTANHSNPALVGNHLGHEPQPIRGSNHKAALSKVGHRAGLS